MCFLFVGFSTELLSMLFGILKGIWIVLLLLGIKKEMKSIFGLLLETMLNGVMYPWSCSVPGSS